MSVYSIYFKAEALRLLRMIASLEHLRNEIGHSLNGALRALDCRS